jgi:hypothetical protein
MRCRTPPGQDPASHSDLMNTGAGRTAFFSYDKNNSICNIFPTYSMPFFVTLNVHRISRKNAAKINLFNRSIGRYYVQML